MPQWVKVARLDEVSSDIGKVVEINDRQIALFRHQDQFYALDNLCPHRAGPLAAGDVEEAVVSCPWHGWRFSLKTGECPDIPGEKVDCFPVKAEGSDLYIDLYIPPRKR